MQATLSLTELAHLMRVAPPQEGPMGLWRFVLRRIGAGEALFRQGDRCRCVHVVRSGFLRSAFIRGAAEYVTAFPMAGDALGLDGIRDGVHPLGAVALSEAQVAVVPHALLEQMECGNGAPAQLLVALLCRENAHKAEHVALLGRRSSTARAAAYLLHLGERFGELGYSRREFLLPMRHADISSYLGLRPETLSRAFTALSAAALLDISPRSAAIRDAAGLEAVAEGARPESLAGRSEGAPRRRAVTGRPGLPWELQ